MTGDLGAAAANALAGYRRRTRAQLVILCLLAAATLGAFLLDIVTGPSSLSAGDAIRGILAPGGLSRSATVIIWDVRLPQALMAVLVGIALSLAGAEMQTILNNSLASPFTLGLSSAATFGAALAIILGIGIPGVPQTWIVSANAFALAFATAMLLQLLARLRGSGGETLVLFGIALFFTFNALIAIMQFIASEQALQQLVFWTLGSLTRSNQEKIWILLVVIACILPLSFARPGNSRRCALARIAHVVSASTLCGCASSRSCGSAFSPARPSLSSGRLPSSAWSARISPAC